MHHCCGNVQANMHARTDMRGLYACGKAAYTGLGPAVAKYLISVWSAWTSATYSAWSTAHLPNLP